MARRKEEDHALHRSMDTSSNTQLEQAWWCGEEAARRIARDLRDQHFAVLDNFVGDKDLVAFLRAEAMKKGASTPAPPAFEALGQRTDLLLSELKKCDDFPEELQPVVRISCATVRWRAGSKQDRHVDNPGGRQPARLTLAYYMQDEHWDAERHGGCLRIYGEDDAAHGIVDVAPIRDRLIVFFSDDRCPHAVQPVGMGAPDRFTAVLFFGVLDYVPGHFDLNQDDDLYVVDFSSVE